MSLGLKKKVANFPSEDRVDFISFKALKIFFISSDFGFREIIKDLSDERFDAAISKLEAFRDDLSLGVAFEQKVERVIQEIIDLKETRI